MVLCQHNIRIGHCLECDLLGLQSQFDSALRPIGKKLKQSQAKVKKLRNALKKIHPWYCEDWRQFNQPCGCLVEKVLKSTETEDK